MLFAFLSYRSSLEVTTLSILHSLIFQVVINDKNLLPMLSHAYDTEYRQLTSSVAYAETLLENLLNGQPTTFIVTDGLDELRISERNHLLRSLTSLGGKSSNTKILISSRKEHDIARVLEPQFKLIHVHHHNGHDIELFVKEDIEDWIIEVEVPPTMVPEIRKAVKPISLKADGTHSSL